MGIYQLVYRSKSTSEISQNMINSILAKAIPKNHSMQVTGCLIAKGEYFLQFLEGKKETVTALFNHIKGDKRHDLIEILNESVTDKRIFNRWDMGFPKLENVSKSNLEENLVQEFQRLQLDQQPDTFAKKVFWYNVEKLISDCGFYRQ